MFDIKILDKLIELNINTITNEHNYSVEYIYVPFRDALLMGESN